MPAPTNLLTLSGNLTADPELRYTQGGVPVASFTVAHSHRYLDRQTNEWIEGETLFMRCSVWREYAERVAGSVKKGDGVTVVGQLSARTYETTGGEKRTVIELTAHDVAASMRYALVSSTRVQRASDAVEPGGAWSQLEAAGSAKAGRRAAA